MNNREVMVMKAMKKMMMGAAVAAALTVATTGRGFAQRINESAVSSGRLTISSVSPVTGTMRVRSIGDQGVTAARVTTQSGSPALQLDVNGTLDGSAYNGLWSINRFEKRGKRLYAVGYLVNTSSVSEQSSSSSGEFINGGSYSGTITPFYDENGRLISSTPLYDENGMLISSSPSYDENGTLTLSSPNYSRGSYYYDTLGIYLDTLGLSMHSPLDATGVTGEVSMPGGYRSGSVTGGSGNELSLSERLSMPSVYGSDTLAIMSGIRTGSLIFDDNGNIIGTMPGDTMRTISVAATEVAVPVTIAGATCDALYLTLGPSEKPTTGNAYRGVMADAGMQFSGGGSSVVISSNDLASNQSSETLCTISRILNGNGSTNALVAQLNTLIGSSASL
jgi:hypothetical protein